MKMKKNVYDFILLISVIAIASCSSHKNNDDDQSIINSGKIIEKGSNNISYLEDDIVQIQKLQKNNIIYFGLDKYDICSNSTRVLTSYASFLHKHPSYRLTVEGHADERGTPEYNISLGERRANAVKMYLQGNGILSEKISIISYGKEKPALIGHDEIAYSKNRRAVLLLISD
ncbi:peptidoglycan-associated lipoprotein Pal [Candidatus Profftia tarda]|uniref:Peptidoglycan-associated lipoprotein n=1 Tax=Candidatus Profftia tarda TaxID=1177216 RepID=A0A8E4F049_9ENTR|nr:peptidoglycan-associated lipoprotein Pal [Candidatus Profftia tarda]CAD6509935.1 Peptidoglycan-associated lipoprotein [Candidatus Profftia tarda]